MATASVPWHELSPAEQDVAVLAAAGWTNTDIATRRGSSIRTVDVQVAAVLHKLMIGTRADIAAFVPGISEMRSRRLLPADRGGRAGGPLAPAPDRVVRRVVRGPVSS